METFKELINNCKYPVFFTGAGISTDSGIPDFRGPQGFWKTNQPIYYQDFMSSDDMRKKYSHPKLRFYIGDVRDYSSVLNVTSGVDYIFHAAALKQVPSCEFYPLEAVKTNILGTENVLEAAMINNVNRVVCLSTDKAVYPINAMGISKAMMEKVIVGKSRNAHDSGTVICCTRYGNVMASRGSVIPLFLRQIFLHLLSH